MELYLLFSVLVAFVAWGKGRNAMLWGVMALCFTPILMGVIVLLVRSR